MVGTSGAAHFHLIIILAFLVPVGIRRPANGLAVKLHCINWAFEWGLLMAAVGYHRD